FVTQHFESIFKPRNFVGTGHSQDVRSSSNGFLDAPLGQPFDTFGLVIRVQPHAAASPATADGVHAVVDHLHQLDARNGSQQGTRFFIQIVVTAQAAGVVVGDGVVQIAL